MFERSVCAVVLVAMVTACAGSDESGGDPSVGAGTATDAPITVPRPADSSAAGFEAFCVQFDALRGERTEAYVGSPEHIVDIEALMVAAPDAVSADVVMFRDFLASGVVDAASDPDSVMTENWPDAVQEAIVSVQGFEAQNC